MFIVGEIIMKIVLELLQRLK